MALSNERIDAIALQWSNKNWVEGGSRFNHDFARAIEAEVRKVDTELIRRMLDVWLPLHAGNYKLTKTDAAAVNAVINAARARLKE